jgi:hypothetical protein
MTEETTNLALEHLRHIRAVVDGMRADMKHFIMRMGLAQRNIVSLQVADGAQNAEIDRINVRLDRIERRLQLTNR